MVKIATASASAVTTGNWEAHDGTYGTWTAEDEGGRWISQDGTTEGGYNIDADSELTGTWWSDDNNQRGTWSSEDASSDIKTASITFNLTSGEWTIYDVLTDACSTTGTWQHDTL